MQAVIHQIAFIDGIGFDPFFRGLLSVLVGIVVLVGGTYMIIATNTGARSGMLIACAGLFGWMFLMGIIWTVYGIGWRGDRPTWELVEINVDDGADRDDGLLFSEVEVAQGLAGVDVSVESDDPDQAQVLALEKASETELNGWRYLPTSDAERGEAQASADEYLVEEGVFESGDYLPLQFGGFVTGGKPVLAEDANQLDRVWHFFDETFLHPTFSAELMVIQVQEVVAKPSFPGQPPPVAEVDPEAALVSVIMERDRGGPIPSIIGGLRFTPLMFTVATGLLFAIFAWALHTRDRHQEEIRAAAAT